jgi:hypothetical protein
MPALCDPPEGAATQPLQGAVQTRSKMWSPPKKASIFWVGTAVLEQVGEDRAASVVS